jgi:serine protease Do
MSAITLKKWSPAIALVSMIGLILGVIWLTDSVAKAPAPSDQQIQMVPSNFARLAREVQPGVVNIRTVKTMRDGGPVFRHFFGQPFGGRGPFGGNPEREFKQRSLGSGFIIDSDGHIITNNHVIENADEITIGLSDGREFSGDVIGRDPNTDLALVKIEHAKDLKPLAMGSSDRLEVGSWVVAVGSPFGLEQTVTAGIVSAKGRVIGAGPYDDFIQTDASINPGNSGGPLLDLAGEVVGINTAIVARGQGIGFAIPIDMARNIVAQLKESGRVTRGWLGVGIQNLTPELAEYYGLDKNDGVLVTRVFEGDPAEKAGIEPRDVIVALNGEKVTSIRQLTSKVASLPVGEALDVTVVRGGEERTFTAEVAKRQDEVATLARNDAGPKERLGLQLVEPSPETARRFGHEASDRGVLVMAVKPGSRAEKAGIQTGDLIKEINRAPVGSVAELRRGVDQADRNRAISLLVKRPNAGFVVIKIS